MILFRLNNDHTVKIIEFGDLFVIGEIRYKEVDGDDAGIDHCRQ